MCSLIVSLSFVECHASKNSLLFNWEHLSKIVTLSKSKSCLVCCARFRQKVVLIKGGEGS